MYYKHQITNQYGSISRQVDSVPEAATSHAATNTPAASNDNNPNQQSSSQEVTSYQSPAVAPGSKATPKNGTDNSVHAQNDQQPPPSNSGTPQSEPQTTQHATCVLVVCVNGL